MIFTSILSRISNKKKIKVKPSLILVVVGVVGVVGVVIGVVVGVVD